MVIKYCQSGVFMGKLMHAKGPNVAGVIGSAISAGIFLSFFG